MADAYRILKIKASDPIIETYRPMLESRFLRSLRHGNEYFKLIDKPAFYSIYRMYFRTLLTRPEAILRLAVLDDDSDIVLGWSLMEPRKLHYVHVNDVKDGIESMRKRGMGRALVPEEFDIFTHITRVGVMLWPKFPQAKFNPFF